MSDLPALPPIDSTLPVRAIEWTRHVLDSGRVKLTSGTSTDGGRYWEGIELDLGDGFPFYGHVQEGGLARGWVGELAGWLTSMALVWLHEGRDLPDL